MGHTCPVPFEEALDGPVVTASSLAVLDSYREPTDVVLVSSVGSGHPIQLGFGDTLLRMSERNFVGDSGEHDLSLLVELVGHALCCGLPLSYLPELLGVCDTLAVMHRGRMSSVRPIGEWDEHSIMRVATSGKDSGRVEKDQ